ncbi:hypothetical protein [Pyrobaculum islandicum]|uniref:hypothetical protein n=1 Tax=Pyrobaculum islandicum TaxID=2277 RepID=UPI00069D1C4E
MNYAKFLWRDIVFHRAVPLNAQLRVEDEKDISNVVFVDLKSGVIKVWRLRETFVVKLKKSDVA